MKLWHLFLHNLLGLDDSLAWFLSVFGLVITVRAIIAPFSWKMYKSARIGAQIRPQRAAIAQEFEGRHDEESVREMQERTKALNKEYGVNPFAGCVPILIQIPTIIGLYRVLLLMARPEGGLENPIHQSVGFLTASEVEAFLQGRINNVPLPAYVSMPEAQLNFLNTTRDDVLSFVLPLFIAAAVFTAFNMVLSIYRSFQTNDYASALSNKMLKVFIVLAIVAPIFPLFLGLTGPFPTAIALYWVANNVWTFGQTAIMHTILEKKYPLNAEFKAHHIEMRADYRTAQKEKRNFYWNRRKNRLLMLFKPHRVAEFHAENVANTEQRNAEIAKEKTAKKDLAAKRRATQRKINQDKLAQSRAAKKKAQATTLNDENPPSN